MTTSPIPPSLSETPRGWSFATFRPAAHWSPEIRAWDGMRCEWRRAWIISAGPHRGEWACIPVMGPNEETKLSWAPESELVDRE